MARLVTPTAMKNAVTAMASLKPEAVAVEINAMKFAVRRPVRAVAVTKMWMQRMILARCWVIANDTTSPFDARVFCRATYDALTLGTFEDFDPEDAEQRAKMDGYFGALIAAGAMTDEDRLDTLALSDVEMTGADLFGRPMDETDIRNIRAELP